MPLSYTQYSDNNFSIAQASKECACVFCLEKYPGSQVKDYTLDTNGPTAICPKCGVDAVIPKSLVEYTDAILQQWHQEGFGVTIRRK